MAWFDTVTRSVAGGVQGLASGVWAAVATPFVHTPLRPVTKQAIKGSLWVAHGARSLVEGTQEEWHALMAEAEAEAHAGTATLDADRRKTVGGNGQTGDRQAPAAATSAGTKVDSGDLTAVKGIGDDYARLLRAAGVLTIAALAARDPEPLRSLLLDANETHEIVGRVPSTNRLQGWIERAGESLD